MNYSLAMSIRGCAPIQRLFMLLLLVSTQNPLMAEKSKLVYGLVPDAPPTTYIDGAGTPTGFFIEFYSRIMDELGIEYEFKVEPFPELYPQMLSGDVDFFTTLFKTPERMDYFIYPEKGTAVGWSQLFVQSGTVFESILDLQHKTIGVVAQDNNGQNFKAYIDSLEIPCTIQEFPNFEALVQAVIRGDVYGGVQSNWFVALEHRVQPTTVVFAAFKSYPVLSKKSPFKAEFYRITERAGTLMADPHSYYYDLQEKWLGRERTETKVIPKWLITVLITLIAAAFLSALIIRFLTRQLRHSNEDLEIKVEERTDRLLHTEKLAALGNLVAGIAHELNTPLHALLTGTDILSHSLEARSPDLLSRGDKEKIALLLSNRSVELNFVRTDSRAARRLIREYLVLHGAGQDMELEGLCLDLGILEPENGCIQILKEASEELLLAAREASACMDAIEIIKAAAIQMDTVIKSLRSYAHRDHRDGLSIVSLEKHLDEALDLYASRFTKEVKLEKKYAGLPLFRCYSEELRQVWLCLIANALDALDGDGRIEVQGLETDAGILIKIIDNGRGIPLEDKDRVFDPFYSTKSEGAGLGLSIAREVLYSHRGKIDFESSPSGTIFTVTLPLEGIVEGLANG
ncbi:hypothetical protein MASR2M78_18510 [Treponema sp.]